MGTNRRLSEKTPRKANLSFLLIRRLAIIGTGRSKRMTSVKTSKPQNQEFIASSLITHPFVPFGIQFQFLEMGHSSNNCAKKATNQRLTKIMVATTAKPKALIQKDPLVEKEE
jgi:hypothetical protein